MRTTQVDIANCSPHTAHTVFVGHRTLTSLMRTYTEGMPMVVCDAPTQVKPSSNIRGRILLTYAADSVKHVTDVLKLHDLLVSNHFRCRLEEYDKHMDQHEHERLNALFHEVDFILVCISPEYKAITEDPNAGFNYDHRTQYVYQAMLSEYCLNTCSNKRFVPVVFERSGATHLHVPYWLSQSSPRLYHWRSDWKDLIKNLSKMKRSRSSRKAVDECVDR